MHGLGSEVGQEAGRELCVLEVTVVGGFGVTSARTRAGPDAINRQRAPRLT